MATLPTGFSVVKPGTQSGLPAGFSVVDTKGSLPKLSRDEASVDAELRYNAALDKVHGKYFQQMDDATFKDYAAKTFAPTLGKLARQGQTAGLEDEIDSGIGAIGNFARQLVTGKGPGFSEAFNDLEELQNASTDLARIQSGPVGAAVEIGSGVLSAGPKAVVQGAAQVAPSLLRLGAEGVVTGAGVGAVSGAATAENTLNDRVEGALGGAKWGAALGGVLPLGGRAIGTAFGNIKKSASAGRAARALGVDPEAAKFVQATMAADDALSPNGIARMDAAGNEAMLADAGASGRNALDYAIQSSGKAGTVARDAITARVDRDTQAINDALDVALGKPEGVNTTRSDIRTGSAPARGAAYDAAYNAPIDYSSEAGTRLDDLLGRLDKSEIEAANSLMRKEGLASKQILAEVADDGSVTYKTKPDVRQIDYITRALNDVAEAANAEGKLGGTTNKGRIYGGLSRDIRDSTKTAVPEYAKALDTAADPIRRSQAVQYGAEALRPSITRETVAGQVKGMTEAELKMMAQGVRSDIDDRLARVTRAVQDGDVDAREAIAALKLLSSGSSREKVALVIGDDAATTLFKELDRATKSFELRASVADNSKTFQRQEMGRRLDATTDPDTIFGALGRGEPVNAGKRAIRAVTGNTPARVLARKDAIMTDAADILTRKDADARFVAQGLQALGRGNSAGDATALGLGQFGQLGGYAGSREAGRQSSGTMTLREYMGQ